MKTLIACLGLTVFLHAQDASKSDPRPEIQGTVLEGGSNLGLAGAEVSITLEDQPTGTPARVVTSDSQGVFHFEPDSFGHYVVKVKLEGYRPLLMGDVILPIPMFGSQETHVALTRGYPKETVRFVLVRPAELTGRLVDEETGKPLPKAPVAAMALYYKNGRRSSMGGGRAVTDDAGQFVFSNLIPGNYVVETLPKVAGAAQILTEFSGDDLKKMDLDYERAFWPGGSSLELAVPLTVASGASLSVGTLKARTVQYYRMHALFSAGNCSPGENVQVRFEAEPPSPLVTPGSGNIPCGKDFLITNLQAGSYRVAVYSGRIVETRVQATAAFDVKDRNVDVAVSLQRGLDVEGRIVAADGAGQLPLDRLQVWVQSMDIALSGGGPFRPDAQGRFRSPNAALGRQHVAIENLGNFYVREIRYGGLPVQDNTFVLAAGSTAPLEIVLDDKPAAITGIVSDDDQPMSKPYVVLTSWPLPAGGMNSPLKNVTGDDQGRFRFGGLPPGDYRIFAVPGPVKSKLDEPGILDLLLSGATKVTLDAGGFQDVRLKPSDPLHP